MVKLADTPDLGSGAARREGSSPSLSIVRSALVGSDPHHTGKSVNMRDCHSREARVPFGKHVLHVFLL